MQIALLTAKLSLLSFVYLHLYLFFCAKVFQFFLA